MQVRLLVSKIALEEETLVNKKGIGAYRQTEVLTADPMKLVLMCYQGAIDSVRTAKERFQSGQYEAKAKALQKANDIIMELSSALDLEKGDEIARNLEMLYRYMHIRLTNADLDKDIKGLDEVIGMLEELKAAWEQICNKPISEADLTLGSVTDQGIGPETASNYRLSARW
jgi:flagellar protein FliS